MHFTGIVKSGERGPASAAPKVLGSLYLAGKVYKFSGLC
jgi:hypothetical protein